MERPGRLTAALAALTVPWLAPQMGCSLLSDETSPKAVATAPAAPTKPGPVATPRYTTSLTPAAAGAAGQAGPVIGASYQPAADTPQAPPPRPAGPDAGSGKMAGSSNEPLKQPAAPALEATDRPLPINLATALRLADARPLIVAAAQAQSWVAEAEFQRASVLWLPQLNLGGDYERHDGYGPDFNRGLNTAARPLNQNINFVYAGGGLIYAPGVQLTDMIFAPIAARRTLTAQRWGIQTGKNDALQQTARAYFDVHRARGTYAGALDAVARARLLVARIESYAGDLVPRAEVDRARRSLADLEQQAATARENWRLASADLTQVLRLDPRAVVEPIEPDQLQITMIDPAQPLDELIPIGLTNRPELAAQQAVVQAQLAKIREERLRPFLPTLYLQGFQTPQQLLQFGATGIGSGAKLNLWSFRDDFSPQLMWQADGLGFGNMARVKEQRGLQSVALIDLARIQDAVAAEVTRGQARLQSAAVRVTQAERGLREALTTFDKNYEGLRQTIQFGNVLVQAYRPQEAVAALENLKRSYDEYYGTVADYNQAQFDLFHALGYPAQDLSTAENPGRPLLIDTSRPEYLPPVTIGPPPATR
jgi:outer membrane protein TolC